MADIFARKPVEAFHADLGTAGRTLRRALGAFDLVLLGIGAIIGTGIFVLTGVAAVQHAGPAVILSFAVAGFACALAALCYSEFATMIPIAGSAYSYGYSTLGEIFAWIIGWDLVLEYTFAASAVSVGWSGYVREFLAGMGLPLPVALSGAPGDVPGAIFNLPAFLIMLVITGLMVRGIRESARFNAVIVAIKTAVVLFVIVAGVSWVDPENWQPFMPYGWGGVFTGASVVFFAYIGFDAVSTAAEEARRPERDMMIGIVGSLVVCTVLYLAVSAVVTGMVPLGEIDLTAPVAAAFSRIGNAGAAVLISIGAIAGLTSVLLVMMIGQTRVLFAMSRDGLLPGLFSRVHPRFGTPHVSTIGVGAIVATIAAFGGLGELVELVNIGTLFAFVIVSLGVVVLRKLEPDRPRPFRCPAVWIVAPLSVLSCGFLMARLPAITWWRFGTWLGVGMLIYFAYGVRNSRVQRQLGSAAGQ
jgi:APA family basic amino acid/polyamine antiporter